MQCDVLGVPGQASWGGGSGELGFIICPAPFLVIYLTLIDRGEIGSRRQQAQND